MDNDFWVPALRYIVLAALVLDAARMIRSASKLGLLWLMAVALTSTVGIGMWSLLMSAHQVSDMSFSYGFGLIMTVFGAVEFMIRRRTRRQADRSDT